MVSLNSGFCRDHELAEVLTSLDQEFVYSRHRTVALRERFAEALDDPGQIVVRRAGESIISVLVVKRFLWHTPKAIYRAAMIGMVWTLDAMRGQGHAAANLAFARAQLIQEQRDFAVLWTAQPHVYASHGWISTDRGCYGVLSGASSNCANVSLGGCTFDSHAINRVHELREQFAATRLLDAATDRLPLPLPAVELRILLEHQAYAIAGLAGDNAYVFDILGDTKDMPRLWERLTALGTKIHLNIQAGTPVYDWFAQELKVNLSAKPLAMWLPLSAAASELDFESFYIPMLDRI